MPNFTDLFFKLFQKPRSHLTVKFWDSNFPIVEIEILF